jgi:hypothetical protein
MQSSPTQYAVAVGQYMPMNGGKNAHAASGIGHAASAVLAEAKNEIARRHLSSDFMRFVLRNAPLIYYRYSCFSANAMTQVSQKFLPNSGIKLGTNGGRQMGSNRDGAYSLA